MDFILSLILLLPLLGFLGNGWLALSGRHDRKTLFGVTLLGCAAPFIAFLLGIYAVYLLKQHDAGVIQQSLFTWAAMGAYEFSIDLYLDRLSAVMVLIITGIGTLIHVYSSGYMKNDPGYARYFAYLNLFVFFMLLLVLGQSLFVLFIGWEGVGLASYLLIGFWFKDPQNAKAGKKAFIVNRIGDAGFLLGIFATFALLGTLEMQQINAAFATGDFPVGYATLIGLLLFVGAMGKSAQIPLHVWLADAMAGPTPVSALIHAATMVTAGIYLLVRLSGLYEQTPAALTVIASIGVITAFMAATIACVQTDIKKVLAYSTVSQLGFMFLAVGVGAYGVAIFHLYTHAFFKACLFLAAGSVIHALQGEQNIRHMGGLRRQLPLTFAGFAIATAAIAGIPPLAGFFSKDEILWFALSSTQGGHLWLWMLATITAFLTAFYMFRLLWLVFMGSSRVKPELCVHVHEAPWSMSGVVLILAAGSMVAGFFMLPNYLAPLLAQPAVEDRFATWHLAVMLFAMITAFAGALFAIWRYGSRVKHEVADKSNAPLHSLLYHGYYFDAFYARYLANPLQQVSRGFLWRILDQRIIDATLHALASGARSSARLLAYIQTGQIQLYIWVALIGLILSLLLIAYLN